jgi:hypothetical protein
VQDLTAAHRRPALLLLLVLACAGVLACTPSAPDSAASGAAPTATAATPSPPSPATSGPTPGSPKTEAPVVIVSPSPASVISGAIPPPPWIGTRVLPRRPDGFGYARPTPPKLRDRRFVTTDLLPPPPDERWRARITRVPDSVVRRSTWHPDCPVALDELAYLTMTFWGFDDRPHTGEMIVNTTVARDVRKVFRRMYRARFPIEEMRVRRAGEIDLPPTGDGNNTESFDCRNATLGGSWSNHAYGLAIDINPFHNPYRRGDLVVPELAEAYLDRDRHRPGMIQPGDVVTRAFADIGWGWGGSWATLDDWQHFSANGH